MAAWMMMNDARAASEIMPRASSPLADDELAKNEVAAGEGYRSRHASAVQNMGTSAGVPGGGRRASGRRVMCAHLT